MVYKVLLFVGYCVGQIITPQFFISSENPTYPTGFRAYFVTSSMMIVLQLILMYVVLLHINCPPAIDQIQSISDMTPVGYICSGRTRSVTGNMVKE